MHKGYKIALVAAVIGLICLAVIIIVPSHHVETDYNPYLGKTQEYKEPNPVWVYASMIMMFAFLTAFVAALLTAVYGRDVREPPQAEELAENATEKIECPSCGKMISSDSNFCTYCGEEV